MALAPAPLLPAAVDLKLRRPRATAVGGVGAGSTTAARVADIGTDGREGARIGLLAGASSRSSARASADLLGKHAHPAADLGTTGGLCFTCAEASEGAA